MRNVWKIFFPILAALALWPTISSGIDATQPTDSVLVSKIPFYLRETREAINNISGAVVFTETASGVVPAPLTIAGRCLKDNATWGDCGSGGDGTLVYSITCPAGQVINSFNAVTGNFSCVADQTGSPPGAGIATINAAGGTDQTIVGGANITVNTDTGTGQHTIAVSGITDELALKAPIASPTFTGTVSGITKAMVGLSNVDNTSDISKPISTLVQAALNNKADLSHAHSTSSVTGLDATLAAKAPLDSPTFTGTVSGITKTMVGLGNVDNTTDLGKPISTLTQTALNAKANSSITVSAGVGMTGGGDLSTNRTITMGTPSTVTTSTTNSVSGTTHTHALTVPDATTGTAGLMSATDKTKMDGIADGANNYTHPATHPPSIIAQDSSNRFVTDTQISTWNSAAGGNVTPLTVWPGAQGFGVETSGGINRAGTTDIYEVTTLNPTGVGSLGACIAGSGHRVCVFELSGQINLAGGQFNINNDDITIAGQTAPYPGITIAGGEVNGSADDVVIQHIKFRPGDSAGVLDDGLMILSPAQNWVVDHCSFTWSRDEQFATWGEGGQVSNITVSNSIIAEGIGDQKHGTLIGVGTNQISFIGNLFANNQYRNPYFQDRGYHLFANNYIYNPGPYEMSNITKFGAGTGPSYTTIVGNRWKSGPLTTAYVTLGVAVTVHADTRFYSNDNLSSVNFYAESASYIQYVKNPWKAGLNFMPAASVESYVLRNAGAFSGARDVIDARIVTEASGTTLGKHATCVQQTGTAACDQAAEYLYTTGNVPTVASNSRNLTPGSVIAGTPFTWPSNPNTIQTSGYTALEEVLFALAGAIE